VIVYVVWQKSNETDFLLTMNFILFTNQGYHLQNSSLGQIQSDVGIVSIVRSSPGRLLLVYVVCPKSKCTDFLFKCLLDSPAITSYLLQSMTLGTLHSGSNVFSTDNSSTGIHFP